MEFKKLIQSVWIQAAPSSFYTVTKRDTEWLMSVIYIINAGANQTVNAGEMLCLSDLHDNVFDMYASIKLTGAMAPFKVRM
mmetsp:Transcript_15307/g.20926  ORF Transcript_15307/g.20926 Transcript_15307/m.20926 type:complete len:81 (+) Transcript_15307:168-410(+)